MITIKIGERKLAENLDEDTFLRLAEKWEKNKIPFVRYYNTVYLPLWYGEKMEVAYA